jgi:hypothetical protein
MRITASLPIALLAAACGGSSPPPDTADDASSEPAAESSDTETGTNAAADESEAAVAERGLPTECARQGEVCVPPSRFVQALCNGTYSEATLHLFHEQSPFTRGYLRGKTKAWNASGGASDNEAMLDFDEEVVVLKERSAPQGFSVSGAEGGYDALRWDGSCVTLSKQEVTLSRPPSPKAAKVEWRYLGNEMRDALRKDEAVNEMYRAQRKECKGVTSGAVSLKCVKLTDQLSDVIVRFVREGGDLGELENLPEW